MSAVLTLTTRAGIVDLVAVARFLEGRDEPLTDAERLYVAHALRAKGAGVSAVADILHMSNKSARALLAEPYTLPADVVGITA